MSLSIRCFEYRDFRNYPHFVLEDIPNVTLFVGPNAVGKTNLIEGLQLTTAGTSFRTHKADHLIRMGAQNAFVKTIYSDGDRRLEVSLAISEGKKEYALNGKKKQVKNIKGILPSVLFCPDDLHFIKGSQSIKRAQIDLLGSQLSKSYHAVLKDYEKILHQKNRYLKETVSHSYLESINEVLASIGAQLYVLRASLVERLIPYIQHYYAELSGFNEEVEVFYLPSWLNTKSKQNTYEKQEIVSREEAREQLITAMNNNYQREHDRHTALYGPQVDRIEFCIDGKNAALFASQGQQRSLVLSYKMAEVAVIKGYLNQNPVLLLDDVMSELDIDRREKLLSLISEDIQTFISSTNSEQFSDSFLQHARVVRLG